MRVFKFLFAVAIFSSGSMVKSIAAPSRARITPNFTQLKSKGYEVDYSTIRPEGTIIFIKSAKGGATFISKDAPPNSNRSIQAKISQMGGVKASLKTVSTPKGTLFGFESKDGQMHFFSTVGGYLSLTPGKNFAKESLTIWMNRVDLERSSK